MDAKHSTTKHQSKLYILKENLYTLYKQNLSQFFFDDKTNDILFKMKTKSIKTLLDVEYSYS